MYMFVIVCLTQNPNEFFLYYIYLIYQGCQIHPFQQASTDCRVPCGLDLDTVPKQVVLVWGVNASNGALYLGFQW